MKDLIGRIFRNNSDVTGLGTGDTGIRISPEVFAEIGRTIGTITPETGGMIACSRDMDYIDCFRFDKKSVNSSVSYSYDVGDMDRQHRIWKEKGIRSVGFVHSHPSSYRQPSYDDVATSFALMKYFGNDVFYLPIVICERAGGFSLYFFVARSRGSVINVNLDYVIRSYGGSNMYCQFRRWNNDYTVRELEAYYRSAAGEDVPSGEDISAADASVSEPDYFERVKGMYPDKVLDKVITCVGTGGARTVLENMARNGFRNFVLIDGDRISPSNIATQGVFISEMGMYKTEAIRRRILDINPKAKVVCVNRFLDDSFTDEEFCGYLRQFPGKNRTDHLVLGCCDAFHGNKRASELSLKYGLPYIGAGMYRQGLAAEIIFVYPGVTESCPRCLLRSRYEAYELEDYKNDVTSAGCPTFATERLNTAIGFISLMMLMYGEAEGSPYNRMLDGVKDRNFVSIRMSPFLAGSELGENNLFDRVFSSDEVSRYTFMDETIWVPQHPDSPEYGEERCRLCGGVRDLRRLRGHWPDTRRIGKEAGFT